MPHSPAVNLDSMQRAKSTLEDFVSSYFMFHNLTASEPLHVFKHLPLLMFVEAHIYQLDQENEDFVAAAGIDTQNPVPSVFEQRGQCLEENFLAGPASEKHQSMGGRPDSRSADQDCYACHKPDSAKQVPLMAQQRAANVGDQKPAERSCESDQQVALKRDKPDCTFGQDLMHQRADSLGRYQKRCRLNTPHVSNDVGTAITSSMRSDTVQACDAVGLEQFRVSGNLAGTAFAPLSNMLHRENLLTVRIVKQLEDGLEFWRLERKLCQELERGQQVKRDEVERAVTMKSFDYRVLNFLLYGLERKEVNEQHTEFLEASMLTGFWTSNPVFCSVGRCGTGSNVASELLVEISDDLFDYEDDVLNNTFNVHRMFLAMYGPQQGQLELAHWISEIERRYERLLGGLEKNLADKYRERCRSAAKEGGSKTDASSPMGSWSLPPPIIDEVAYRLDVQQNC